MNKKYTPFAVYNKDGKDTMYVEIGALTTMPIVLFLDGISIVGWGNEGRYYTDIDSAITWVKGECRDNPKYARKHGEKILHALEKGKKKFLAGELIENE